MPISTGTESGRGWSRLTSFAGGPLFGPSARRIIIEGGGDLYLIPVGGSAGAGTLFYTGAGAGQQFDQQCDGIGSSTTCTAVVVQF